MLTVQDLLSALAKRLESGPLYLSRDNLCRVQVDDLELNIEWLEDEDAAYVYLPLGALPDNQNNELLQELMEANLFFQGTTDQALFGLDRELRQLFLFQRFSLASLQDAHFVSACIAMVEHAKMWQQKLLVNTGRPKAVATLSAFSEFN